MLVRGHQSRHLRNMCELDRDLQEGHSKRDSVRKALRLELVLVCYFNRLEGQPGIHCTEETLWTGTQTTERC